MRIGIHQPNFIPWMGYFYKISLSDTFVFLDHVEYTKNSFTKRVKIHAPNDLLKDQYITVPLRKHSDYALINTLQIAENHKWQKKIAARIYETYHKAPYYHQIEPLLVRFFENPEIPSSFSFFNMELIIFISELLGISPRWVVSSELDITYSGLDVNLDILTFLDGTTYLSGMGAQKYQDHKQFDKLNIELTYADFPSKFKTLSFPDHFFDKSILSYLVHYDLESLKDLLRPAIL